jgi:hypothetical protein
VTAPEGFGGKRRKARAINRELARRTQLARWCTPNIRGLTCECNLAPRCGHHHRCKQADGWQLTQS